jgi:hypothetical protein
MLVKICIHRARPLLHTYMIRPVGSGRLLLRNDDYRSSPFFGSFHLVDLSRVRGAMDLGFGLRRRHSTVVVVTVGFVLCARPCTILPLIWSHHAWHAPLKQRQRMARPRTMTPSDNYLIRERGAYQRPNVSDVHRTSCHMGISGAIHA